MNIKQHFLAAAVIAAAFVQPAMADPREVGVINFTFDAPHRDRIVQSLVFYPAETGGRPEWVGDNAVFRGVPVQRDAMPERKKHPLVVISHGSGGNGANLAWLAKRIAEEGYVVAVPNHQSSTSGDSRPETTVPAIWQRPADMSRMLDAIAASPAVSSVVDLENITALGFSLGGMTSLSLAGATLEAPRLAKFCDDHPELPMGCAWLAHGNSQIPGHVDLHKIDEAKFNASFTEKRIKRFIAIDPGWIPALNEASVRAITAPVQVINLGDPETMPVGLNAEDMVKTIPNGRYDRVSGSNHFDFLAECKALGWFYIWLEGDDPVCTEQGSRSRAEIHREIGDKVLRYMAHSSESRT